MDSESAISGGSTSRRLRDTFGQRQPSRRPQRSVTNSPLYSVWHNYAMGLSWASSRHDASYKSLIKAASLGLKLKAVEARIAELMTRAGREPQPSELANQWPRAQAFVAQNKDGARMVHPPKTDLYNKEVLQVTAQSASGIEDIRSFLLERSPERTEIPPWEYLSKVFPNDIALVCPQFTSAGYYVRPNEDNDWLVFFVSGKEGNPEGTWFLSNPVNGELKVNAAGHESARSEPNVTSFRHVVIESDDADPDLWLRAWVTLKLPIVSITESGNPDSCAHVLVRINAASKADWTAIVEKHFKRGLLAALGADLKVMTAVRLTRLPNVHRLNKGGFQRLLYLNPNPEPKAIL